MIHWLELKAMYYTAVELQGKIDAAAFAKER
jgi:hypothetical protein